MSCSNGDAGWYGTASGVPNYYRDDAVSGLYKCFYSAAGRTLSTFDCSAEPSSASKKRLCYCVPAPTPAPTTTVAPTPAPTESDPCWVSCVGRCATGYVESAARPGSRPIARHLAPHRRIPAGLAIARLRAPPVEPRCRPRCDDFLRLSTGTSAAPGRARGIAACLWAGAAIAHRRQAREHAQQATRPARTTASGAWHPARFAKRAPRRRPHRRRACRRPVSPTETRQHARRASARGRRSSSTRSTPTLTACSWRPSSWPRASTTTAPAPAAARRRRRRTPDARARLVGHGRARRAEEEEEDDEAARSTAAATTRSSHPTTARAGVCA